MTKNTTKTAAFKTFDADRLAAGKYAGMGINRSEEREHEGRFFAYYSSSARNVSRDWYGIKAADIAAIGYDCLGFWDIPAGLKAAATMVCRISDYFRKFRFHLSRSGAWMFHYDNPEGIEYSNGSAEDVSGDRVEMDDDQNARDFVWALSRYERVQFWEKDGRIFMAVGSIDDGRLLLLNDGVKARFTAEEDDVWAVDPVAEVVAAVASYPAAPVAACEAPRAEDEAQEGENALGGTEVRPEEEKAPEAKESAKDEAPEKLGRVTGEWLTHAELMAHPEKCPKIGDVVEVRGGPVKGQEGFFFIDAWNSARYCGESYYGQGLNARKIDDVTKKRLYWPIRNCAGTAAAEEANRTEAKMRVLGPVSIAGLEYVRSELDRMGEYDQGDEWVGKYTVELSLALARMEEENPALFKATRKADAEGGTGLKIAKNGLYVRESGKWELYGAFYSVDGRHDGRPCVTIYAKRYGDLPKGFGLEIVNDSDPYTDYVTGDRATVYEDHPLYKKFREAAEGAKHYHLTAEDVESVREYVEDRMEAARKAREAEEKKERKEREAHYLDLEKKARESVSTWSEAFPHAAGVAPFVTVEWCEINALHETGEEHAQAEGTPATRWSLDAFNMVTEDLDRYVKGCGWFGYFKLKYTVEFPDGTKWTDRIDLGDGVGGLVESARAIVKYNEDRKAGGDDYAGTIYGGSVEDWRERLERLEAATDPDAVAMARGLLELGETA